MKSSLRDVLPEEISDESEAIILEKIRGKMRGGCGMLVKVVRALEARFGKEAVHDAARQALHQVRPRPAGEVGTPEADLATYTEGLEKGCAGSHEGRRTDTTPRSVSFEFTSCMWADVFKELDATDIGIWICEGDDFGARSYNPDLRCTLTKTLMGGDDVCDHVFHVADGA